MTILRAAIAATTLALLAACGADEPAPTAATTTTTAPPVRASVDWARRTVDVGAVEGYTVTFCDGDAPMLCVASDGSPAGVFELTSYPVSSIDVLAGGDLEAWAEDFAEALAGDRRAGCGDDYVIEADEPVPADLGGHDGVRYRITGTSGGRTVERVVGVAAVVDAQLWLLAANGLEPDGCLSRESELRVADLDRLTPTLLRLAAGSELPARGETVTGWLRSRTADAVTIDPAKLLTGDEAVAAARADGAEELPTDFYVDDVEPGREELRLADDVVVELYDCTAACELRAVPAADFLGGRVQPFGGPEAMVSVVTRDGEVERISEIYLP